MLPHEPTLPEDLATAWESVLSDWSSDAPHVAFIELCAMRGRLADAGALYRRAKELDAERAELAEKQLQRIMARALAMLAQHTPVARDNVAVRRLALAVAVVVAGLMMGSALWAVTRLLAAQGG